MKKIYQADFDAILNSERLSNARVVSEYITISLLKVLNAMKDNEKIGSFLISVLDRVTRPG